VEVGNRKNKVGNGGGVVRSLYIKVALDWVNDHSAVQVPGLDPELVIGEFPEIEAQPDDDRELGMDTGEIPGNDGIESSDYRKFPRIFLREITKGKKFYFHVSLLFVVLYSSKTTTNSDKILS